jgi:hypothetical protein
VPCSTTLLGIGRAGELALHVGERALDASGVAGLRTALELVVERRGACRLLALPVLPAGPGQKGAGREHHDPGDQRAVGVPEMLELIELFLFFEIEMGGHVLSVLGSRGL